MLRGGVPSAPIGKAKPRAVAAWLLSVAALVFVMIVVGGITRLTESGLSMVDWRPVTGLLPPLSDEAWRAMFEAYKASPQYRIVNQGMSLDDFRTIFWWEYIHRLLGRVIGLAYALPLAVFWLRRRIPRGYKPRLLGLLVLGALQGGLGWFMVRSGLVDVPEVSHLRLTAHLTLAFAIFALLVWTALDLMARRSGGKDQVLRGLSQAVVGLVFLQVILGGLVAGLRAGHIYNTWPLMDGGFLPDLAFAMQPWWRNIIDNAALVQFNHRMGAYLLLMAAVLLFLRSMRRRVAAPDRLGAVLLLVVLLAQAVIGIATLLASVPIGLGALHQAGGAMALFMAVLVAHGHRKDHHAA